MEVRCLLETPSKESKHNCLYPFFDENSCHIQSSPITPKIDSFSKFSDSFINFAH